MLILLIISWAMAYDSCPSTMKLQGPHCVYHAGDMTSPRFNCNNLKDKFGGWSCTESSGKSCGDWAVWACKGNLPVCQAVGAPGGLSQYTGDKLKIAKKTLAYCKNSTYTILDPDFTADGRPAVTTESTNNNPVPSVSPTPEMVTAVKLFDFGPKGGELSFKKNGVKADINTPVSVGDEVTLTLKAPHFVQIYVEDYPEVYSSSEYSQGEATLTVIVDEYHKKDGMKVILMGKQKEAPTKEGTISDYEMVVRLPVK